MKKTEIRALSITQPWAHLIVNMDKNVENRSWNTHRRGYIAIHASSSFKADRFLDCEEKYRIDCDPNKLDYGSIIGFGKLVDVVTKDEITKTTEKWFEGDYGFVFDDVIRLKNPVKVKGTLNFWKVRGVTLKKCLSQLNQSELKRVTSSL